MLHRIPGFRSGTTWKMVIAVFGYLLWVSIVIGMAQSVAKQDASLGGYIWFLLVSILWFILMSDIGQVRGRLPIRPAWLQVLVWGLSGSLVLGILSAATIPESEQYRTKAAARAQERAALAQQKLAQEKAKAEAAKAEADAKKAQAEAEKAKADAEKAKSEASKTTTTSEQSKNDPVPSTAPPATAKEPPPYGDTLRGIIVRSLGDKTNMSKVRVVRIDATPSIGSDGKTNGYTAGITLNGNENLTTNMTHDGLWIDSSKLLQALFADAQLQGVTLEWQLPLTDTYGNTQDGRVMLLRMDRSTANKINWKNFLFKNIPQVTEGYWEHPAFSR